MVNNQNHFNRYIQTCFSANDIAYWSMSFILSKIHFSLNKEFISLIFIAGLMNHFFLILQSHAGNVIFRQREKTKSIELLIEDRIETWGIELKRKRSLVTTTYGLILNKKKMLPLCDGKRILNWKTFPAKRQSETLSKFST